MIKKHPSVADAAVVIQVISKRNTIFAYVVPEAHPASEAEAYDRKGLRRYLQSLLPYYMVPTAIVELDKIPLTPNEKLDKKALPVPHVLDRDQQVHSHFAAPQTPTEKILAEIWSEILHVGVVGVDDNFFELGGDSIISIRVVSKAREKGLGVSIKQIFEHPTVAELSKHVRELHAAKAQSQGKISGVLPNFPIQSWFFEQDLVEANHFNQAEIFLVPSEVTSSELQKSFDALLDHHDVLRITCKKHVDGGYEQFITDGSKSHKYFEVVEVSDRENFQSLVEAKNKAVQADFKLTEGLLIRVVHFVVANEHENYVLVVIHHLAVDGVSWRILLEDLETSVRQWKQKKEITLPPKTASVMDWHAALKQVSQNSAWASSELKYWKDLMVNVPTSTFATEILPKFSELKPTMTIKNNIQEYFFELDANTTTLLVTNQVCSRAFRARIDEVLLCAFIVAFLQWQGEARGNFFFFFFCLPCRLHGFYARRSRP